MVDATARTASSTDRRSAARVAREAENQRVTVVGLALATTILGSWIALHIVGVFFWQWTTAGVLLAPIVVGLLTWLYVGLFIVAHDCMHGSLAPGRPWINKAVGYLVLVLYAGFNFRAMLLKHRDHHIHSGTDADPDFHGPNAPGFWAWYLKFFTEYFSWRELAFLSAVVALYLFVLGAELVNLWVFWSLPAILSSLQLFAFGTYLPHREEAADPFADHHRARTNNFSWGWSLMTCFHFGYHHEHHLQPHVPWWRLPTAHAEWLAQGGTLDETELRTA